MPNCFFFGQKFQLISHKEGKAKRREKRNKITNRTISQDICSLFAHYWYSTSCG